jgi:hypothetical protein
MEDLYMINYDNKETEYLKNTCNSVLFHKMASKDFIDYINLKIVKH